MRHRFTLSFALCIGTLALTALIGAALAQENAPPAPQGDPFLRALGDAPVALAAQSAPAAPPAPAAPDTPAAPPGAFDVFGVASPDGVFTLEGAGDGIQFHAAPDGWGGFVQEANPAALRALFELSGGQYGAAGGQVQLRATLAEGVLTVTMNGQPVAEEHIERDGSLVKVVDAEGRTVATFEIADDGRVTIPAGWSFSGPAQWMNERASRRVIGIRTGTVDPALAHHLGVGEGEGILVAEVIEGHPAAEAGLEPYDVIVAIDGQRPATLESLKAALQEKSEGDSIDLTVVRAGRTIQIRSKVSSVSAPIGATGLPEGTYAFGLGGGQTPEASVAGELRSPPLVSGHVPLLMRRRANLAAGGGVAAQDFPQVQLRRENPDQFPSALSGLIAQRDPVALQGGMDLVVSDLATQAHPTADASAERLGAIEERLEKLEKLLEQLVERRERSPEPRERH